MGRPEPKPERGRWTCGGTGFQPVPPRFRIVAPNVGSEPTAANVQALMKQLVRSLQEHQDAWPFLAPVDPAEVADYYEIVKTPMDLSLVARRVDSGTYYRSLEMFAADLRVLFANCRTYNKADTEYYKCAQRLEQHFESRLATSITWTKRTGLPI